MDYLGRHLWTYLGYDICKTYLKGYIEPTQRVTLGWSKAYIKGYVISK
jgi:hypothetical protein